jgi:hypothetical protein
MYVSSPPVARYLPFFDHRTTLTDFVWPVNVLNNRVGAGAGDGGRLPVAATVADDDEEEDEEEEEEEAGVVYWRREDRAHKRTVQSTIGGRGAARTTVSRPVLKQN